MLESVVVAAAIVLAVVAVVVAIGYGALRWLKQRIRRCLKAAGWAVAGRRGCGRAARSGWRSWRSRAMVAPRGW